MKKNAMNVRVLTQSAMLTAILLVMYFTPLGMLPTPGQPVTLLTVPVAVGAMLIGPAEGALLGCMFGLLSFWRAFQTGTLFALGVSVPAVFVLCVVTRTLMGFCCGWVYRLAEKVDRTHTVSCFIGGLAAPVLNTVFYMSVYVYILLHNTLLQQSIAGAFGEGILVTLRTNVILFIAAYVGVQAVVEAAVGCVVSGLVCKAVKTAVRRIGRRSAAA